MMNPNGHHDLMGATREVEKYCVFESGRMTFAILATAVREVALRPSHANVPDAPPMLAGLTHLRNEFLPLLRDPDLVHQGEIHGPREAQVVIIQGETDLGGYWWTESLAWFHSRCRFRPAQREAVDWRLRSWDRQLLTTESFESWMNEHSTERLAINSIAIGRNSWARRPS